MCAIACCSYVVLDITDVIPGVFTLGPVREHQESAIARSIPAHSIVGNAHTDQPLDASAVEHLVQQFSQSQGVGNQYSLAVAQADGTIVAQHDANTPREPASTLKTLTAFAAASVLDMGSTFHTSTYLLHGGDEIDHVILRGQGDMLLSAGNSDPHHVNGRAGLGTLAQETAQALKQRGITSITLSYDDSLFGENRVPAGIEANNPGNIYYTGVSSMAVDGGRLWNGAQPKNPDASNGYPELSQTPAQDAVAIFVKHLKEQGISVDPNIGKATVDSKRSALATVESAPLSAVMAFMLNHSDNTLAEEFGRLTALAKKADNSPQGAVKAVSDELVQQGIPTDGLHMADCSGLTPGSLVKVDTLVTVQSKNVVPGGAVAAAEGLAVPGLSGTVLNRLASAQAAGLMRVKTGSLSEVTSMTGNVSRVHGGVAAFSIIVNNPTDVEAAKKAINTFIAQLTEL